MKILVTGIGGQLGYDIAREVIRRHYEGVGTGRASSCNHTILPYRQMDITDPTVVDRVVFEEKPDAVIHCAAWTAVDKAEEPDCIESVQTINVEGTRNVANACKKIDCKMIYLSTDYVFDGSGTDPWKPDCQSYHPLNVYGKSKLDGERAVASVLDKYFIVRIAWVFGINGTNFVKTMLRLSESKEEIRVVNDQIGTPTYTYDLARLLLDMSETEKYGYYHATNEGGYISWADFACEIFAQAGKNTKVIPVSTQEYGVSKAVRPCNSRLDKTKLTENGFALLPDWRDALHRFLKELEG